MKNGRTSTREKILAAAAQIFAEQGYPGTTIAQIAKAAGVSEGSIYEHFNGKEDLFLAISTEKLSEVLPLIEDHLFGVKGALNQLRKFIWVYVRHMMENRPYARVALLHLKTSKTFMETAAYREVQRFYGKITEIIEAGQKGGEIKPEINPHSARALVIGSVEHLVIRWLLKDCSYDLMAYLEEVYDLMEDALKAKPAGAVTGEAGNSLAVKP